MKNDSDCKISKKSCSKKMLWRGRTCHMELILFFYFFMFEILILLISVVMNQRLNILPFWLIHLKQIFQKTFIFCIKLTNTWMQNFCKCIHILIMSAMILVIKLTSSSELHILRLGTRVLSRMGAGISKVIHGKIIKKLLNRCNLSLISNFQTEYFLDYALPNCCIF